MPAKNKFFFFSEPHVDPIEKYIGLDLEVAVFSLSEIAYIELVFFFFQTHNFGYGSVSELSNA